jgi:ABC-2 type transport system ATP-binding protein
MAIIEVDRLTRKFGDFTAVDEVSFEVNEGELFGFLGPNGAGKTTTINVLCTLLKPTTGSARINGFNVRSNQASVRRSIGLIFQDETLDERLSGRQNLWFHAMLYGVPRDVYKKRAADLLEMVELTEKAGQDTRSYSGGMRRRLEIARGLLHHPKVLFLDEPTIGLDPQTRRHIWEYLLKVREQEKLTLFLTTHYMDEAEICDRIAIIDNGRIIANESPAVLKAMVGGDIVTLETTDNPAALEKLRTAHGVEPRQGPEGQVIVETPGGAQSIPRFIATLGSGDEPSIEVLSVNLRQPTLEDVFIKLTGRAIRAGGADSFDQMRTHVRAMGRGH